MIELFIVKYLNLYVGSNGIRYFLSGHAFDAFARHHPPDDVVLGIIAENTNIEVSDLDVVKWSISEEVQP